MKNKTIKISQDFFAEDDDSQEEPVSSSKYKKEKEEFKRKQRKEYGKQDRLEIEKEKKKLRKFKSARVIVRNLPFKSTEQSIKEHFSKCGEVVEVTLLKKGDKLVGCGFVQFENKASAASAIIKFSGKPFKGRTIVVDWALPKEKFTKVINEELGEPKVKEEDQSSGESETEVKEEPESSEDEGDSAESEDSNEDEDDLDSEEIEEQPDVSASEESSDEEEEKVDTKQFKKSVNGQEKNKKFHFQYDPEDVSDGRTVFIRNVPFSAKDEDLLECAKEVGSVVYAIVCIDPLTEHSKGTGFIKFNDKAVVSDLIEGKSKLVLKGVKLDVLLALKKNKIQEIKENNKGPKDKRNLYLLREGIILAGSPASVGVSEGDMAKRLQLEHWKTQTLKNLNKFVSTNRLVVHNVPPFVDDSKLKQIIKENSPKGSFITEARIIRNLKDIDENGIGKSKGFGFVSFTKHEDAIEALRKINNNPHIFRDTKRPIVGFSIENRKALQEKEKRKLKSQNPPKKQTADDSGNTQPNSHQGGKKRKFSAVQDDNKSNKKFKVSTANSDNLPEFCGYTSKPGTKKPRSFKELKTQAALHHKAVVDKKRAQKRRIHHRKNFKNQKNIKKKF